jgi:tRNA (guanine10-N2)-methyltransferase
MDFLLRLAQVHESFRLAEIETAATIAGIQIEIISYSPDVSTLELEQV